MHQVHTVNTCVRDFEHDTNVTSSKQVQQVNCLVYTCDSRVSTSLYKYKLTN